MELRMREVCGNASPWSSGNVDAATIARWKELKKTIEPDFVVEQED